MKRYIYRFMFILSTLVPAASCAEKLSDAEDLAGRERTTLEVSYAMAGAEVKSVTVASASVKKTLEVIVNNDNLKWNLESNRDWCVVVPEEHCGSGAVTLSIAANEDFDAREPATLTFVAGDYRGFEITINQNATSFIVGQPYFVSGIAGGTYNVDVTTPAGTEWEFTSEDWMEVTAGTPSSFDELTTTVLTIKADVNDGASRYGTIVLSAGEDTGNISVYQFGTDLEYAEDGTIVLDGTAGASLTFTAPAYVVNSVQAPKFATATVTENEDGTSTVSVSLKENLSDCSENRNVKLSLQLSNVSASVVKLPAVVQDYIPANGLVTAQGVITFAKAVAEGTPTTDWEDNGVVTVKSDIDMSDVTGWTGIGTADSPFKGQFNGGGYEITNLKNTSAGLFANCEGATVKNVVLGKGCSLYFDDEYTGMGGVFGGIVTVAKETTVTECQFNGAMDFAGSNDNDEPAYIGGVVGYADVNSSVTKSRMGGKIVITSSSTATDSYVGGVVGMSYGTVTSNEMSGEIVAQTGNLLTIGGIASVLPAVTEVGNNSFMGTLTMASGATSQMIFGGLYGKILADRTFDKASDKSVSLGKIDINGYTGSATTSLFVGGFVGRAEADVTLSFNGYESQTNIYYDQTVINRETLCACIGGVLGGCDPAAACTSVSFENVSNQGKYSTAFTFGKGTDYPVKLLRGFVGGVAGFINGKAVFKNCTNQGFLGENLKDNCNGRSNNYFMVLGGIAGVVIEGDAEFTGCQNKGDVINRFYSNRYSGAGYNKDGWNVPCVAGGILGAYEYRTSGGTGRLTMTNCVNSNAVQSYRGNVGGILGFGRNATITSCTNTGELERLISNEEDAPFKGGIVAWLVGESSIVNCVAKCTVYAFAPGGAVHHPGGILSLAEGKVTIDGCSYFGNVKSLPHDGITPVLGGIVSQASEETVVKDCKFGGTVEDIPVSDNNVASLAVGNGLGQVSGITLWNGTL